MNAAAGKTIGALAVLLFVVAAAMPGLADRLHLESGGFIDSDSWWYEGEWLMYESVGGTVGIPRSMILRIEKGDLPAAASPFRQSRTPVVSGAPRRPADADERAEISELLRLGLAALQDRRFEDASSLYLRVIRAWPELSIARVGYAMAELALGHDASALGAVLDGLAQDPERHELHELLGDLRDREERLEDALRAWRKAFELFPGDRLREKILKAERDLTASRDFDLSTTSHFTVRYDGEVDLELASALMDYLEEQYWELSDAYAHAPRQPITVLLYPKRQFREVTQSPEWVGGIYDGKIRLPLAGLRRLNPGARGVLVHELTHAVIHSKTRGNCPRWLHEGLAQLSAGKSIGRAERRWIAEQLREIEPDQWDAKAFSYTMALSFTRYLESRRGFAGLVDLLELLATGKSIDEALAAQFGEDYSLLCRRWADGIADTERDR